MDVRKWLDETVQPDLLPVPPEQLDFESFVCPKMPDPVATGKRRRKRSKSDSSLLDPPPRRSKTLVNEHKPSTRESVSEGTNSKASNSIRSCSSKSIVSSQRYARKPRHKTRPERYERPSKDVKEPRKHAHRGQKNEVKNSRRKAKRKKGAISGSGILQNFHTKNVSGDRLTLKPLEKLGIFNNGRTSIAVKGRGLPDLVFSEMKFLQKNKNQTEPSPQQATSKKKREKEHTHTKEGEISAFFATAQPELAEQNGKSRVKDNQQDNRAHNFKTVQHQGERPSVDEITVPIVELPDKASCLGFGSKRPYHESTSYTSWSESVRAPSATPGHSRVRPAVDNGPFCLANREGDPTTANEEDTTSHPPVPPLANKKTPSDFTERLRVSSVPTVHQRVSRSHSYPQHSSSPEQVNLVDRAKKHQSTGAASSPSSIPPFVPVYGFVEAERYASANVSKAARSRTLSLSGTCMISSHRGLEKNDEESDVEMNPHASSSLGRVLQYCNDVFREGCRRNATQTDGLCSMRGSQQHATMSLYPSIQHIPTVRFSRAEVPSPRVSSFSGPSIYQQQAQRQQLLTEALGEGNGVPRNFFEEQSCTDEDGGMAYNDQGWDGFPEQYEIGGDEAGEYDVRNTYVAEDDGQQFVSENKGVRPGFWRPHRLY